MLDSRSGPAGPTRHFAQDSAWARRTRAERERARRKVAQDPPSNPIDPVAYDQPTSDVDPAAPAVKQTFVTRSQRIEPTVFPPEPEAPAAAAPAPVQVARVESAPEPPPQPAAPREMTTGSVLCHRYLLGRSLGTGGGALIFQAEDRRRIGAEDFGNKIAIKVLRPEMRHNAHALTRLKREYRQMQRMTHPGIARVFELARDEDIWFMTMELIDGQTINQWLKSSTSKSSALQLISACSDALSYAHEAGIVHGDLKPSNVLVLADGNVKLVDFGSAAERDAATGEVDQDRSFAATPPYASPQILAGEIADPRDDVFSLACLAYAVLTHGEHPFNRKSSTEAQQLHLKPTYSKQLSPRQFDVIVHALAWDRDARPASVREFLHALLASNLSRDTTGRDAHSSDVHSKPMPSVPIAARVPTPSLPTKDTPTVGATELKAKPQPSIDAGPEIAAHKPAAPQPEAPPAKPASNVRPEDIARLRAAVAAAEAHADRIEHPTAAPAPPPEKKRSGDPLAKFRGYVAGPNAQRDDASDDVPPPVARATDDTDADPTKPSKRVWPWQRSAWAAAIVMIGASIALASHLNRTAESTTPAQTQAALPPHVEPEPAAKVAATAPVLEATATPQVEEKKSPQVVKPAARTAAPAEVTFDTRTLQVGVGQTIAALTVKRANSTRGRARVNWTIEGGTAREGVDYRLDDVQTIEFLEGQSVRSLFIPLVPEKASGAARQSKTFTVKLQPANGGPRIGAIKQVYVTIVGDVADERVANAEDAT